MKQYFLAFILLTMLGHGISAQDSYRKKYLIRDTICYSENYYDSPKEKQDSAGIIYLQRVRGQVDPAILKIASGNKGLLSNVAFGKGNNSHKIYVNPWLVKSNGKYLDRDAIYYYTLQNRQALSVEFREWSLNALTVPLKARFGKPTTEFSTGANLGVLFGYSWGQTHFLHRKDLANKEYDSKWTFGLFLGTDKLEFSYNNASDQPEKIRTALISSGVGLLYSYQKFTLGVTSGFDFGLGKNTSKWDYQARPWLGIAIGYSLFSF